MPCIFLGERPTKEVLMKQPEVVNKNTGFFFSNLIDRPLEPFLKLHRVKVQFGADLWLSYYLYTKLDFDWRALDWLLIYFHTFLIIYCYMIIMKIFCINSIHLMINHRHYCII